MTTTQTESEIERLQEKIVNRDLLLDMHRAEIERLRALLAERESKP